MKRRDIHVLVETLVLMKRAFSEGRHWDAFVLEQSIPDDDLEGKLYLSNNLDAKERFIIKEFKEADRNAGR